MRKQLLRASIISFASFLVSVIYAAEAPHITIRSSYTDISVPQVQSIPNVVIDKKEDWGFWGHSTIIHQYDLKSVNADKMVTDYSTGLMWHQSGSEKYMNCKLANRLVEN